ncbi:MAG: sugar nucleotide-binding protein [Candidatus Peribacteraceae bacterium]|nr:sugar nucleotide-binding protein [Candidatus Peribacteraceae bacterium]HCI03464.1 hypothetical protein [Candidatus Peribacteria bacterium]
MRVVIFGASGYLGSQFMKMYPDSHAPSIDIGEKDHVVSALEEFQPDIVINAVGRTGRPNVDWCEDHKEETMWSNVAGPLILLNECGKRGLYWVHMGSGCIYNGDNGGKGYNEEDEPNFMESFYSKSKAWADQMLKEFPEQVLVLRLRMPFDGTAEERNLITKIAHYDKVLDVQNSVTCIPEFLEATKQLIDKKKTGLYNIVNSGTISPFQIMEMYKEIVDPAKEFAAITNDELLKIAKAPRSNCVLNTDKLKKEGIELRPVEEAVKDALEEIAKNSK